MIDGLTYIPDVFGQHNQDLLLEEVDKHLWLNTLKRRTQHYGYIYDYKARHVDLSMWIGQLPPFAILAANVLKDRKIIDKNPDQLIVNEYLPGQGISAHIDCEPCFDDTIITVSLGWAYEIDFIKNKEVHSLMLEKGSVLKITGAARYEWLHRIRSRKKDHGIPRERRVSLTFRNVILDENLGIK